MTVVRVVVHALSMYKNGGGRGKHWLYMPACKKGTPYRGKMYFLTPGMQYRWEEGSSVFVHVSSSNMCQGNEGSHTSQRPTAAPLLRQAYRQT